MTVTATATATAKLTAINAPTVLEPTILITSTTPYTAITKPTGMVVVNPTTGSELIYYNSITSGDVLVSSGVWCLFLFLVYRHVIDVLHGRHKK